MSQTLTHSQPDVVLRSRYVQLRALLAIACIAIIGLAIAVGVLASSDTVTSPAAARAGGTQAPAQAADTGARLDHRGLHDSAYLSGLGDVGARLDHRGRRGSPKH